MLEAITTEMIASVGFPIVAFFVMYNMCNTTIKENTNAVSCLREAIAELKRRD